MVPQSPWLSMMVIQWFCIVKELSSEVIIREKVRTLYNINLFFTLYNIYLYLHFYCSCVQFHSFRVERKPIRLHAESGRASRFHRNQGSAWEWGSAGSARHSERRRGAFTNLILSKRFSQNFMYLKNVRRNDQVTRTPIPANVSI